MDLTREAEARVQDAVRRAQEDAEALLILRTPAVMKGVERLASAWERLHPAARQWLEAAAEQGLPADASGKPVGVGTAALAYLQHHRGRRGERVHSAVFRSAVQELFAAYVESGGVAEVGNRAHREASNLDAHPACAFVAGHLMRLFPGEFRDLSTALRRADSYLRELDTASQIPTRKKRAKLARS